MAKHNELHELLDALRAEPNLVTDYCSQSSGSLGSTHGCSTMACEPGPDSNRAVLLVPGEYDYMKRTLKEEPKFEHPIIGVERGRVCPYKVNNRCTAGGDGSARPFSCKLFPVSFEKIGIRSARLYVNGLCKVATDPTANLRLNMQGKNRLKYILALWPYMPDWWQALWDNYRPTISNFQVKDISFDIELDVVEYSLDAGPRLVSVHALAALADTNCHLCHGEGVVPNGNKRDACTACAGPRFWNADHYMKQERKSRSTTDDETLG